MKTINQPKWSGNFLSVIIPCFNEIDTLDFSINKIKSFFEVYSLQYPKLGYECIFVNDGSSDLTGPQLEMRKREIPHAFVVHHERNQGLGAAIKTGIAHAKGDMIAVFDADCAYEPMLLLPMLEQINHYEIIDGCPYHPKVPKNNYVPIHRLILSRSVVILYNILLGKKSYCYTCLFRLYRKYVFNSFEINENGFLAVTEIKVKSIQNNISILEFPATNHFRKFGQSKMKVIKNIIQHLKYMSSILVGKIR